MFTHVTAEDEWDRFFREPAISFSNKPILKDLFEELTTSTEKVTFVLGAGVSLDAGLPSWNRLVTNMIAQIDDPRWTGPVEEDESDPMRKAEYILKMVQEATSLSDGDIVRNALYSGGPHLVPGNLADSIARLVAQLGDRASVITTNFDRLFDRALENYSHGMPVLSYSLNEWDSKAPRPPGAFEVLHVHGILEPNQTARLPVVLTESQFLEFGPRVRDEIKKALQVSRVVFVGISLSDPNLVGPLWDVKNSGKPYKEPYLFIVAAPSKSAKSLRDSRAYAIKRSRYLETELAVKTIFLKSYAQIPQVFYDLTLAWIDNAGYASNDPATSLRYGFRFSRALDRAYGKIGCGSGEDLPSGTAAQNLCNELHALLYGSDGLAVDLRGLVDALKTTNNDAIREQATKHSSDLDSEKFGLFLWLRSRADGAKTAEYRVKLVGTSVYVHQEPWSLDRTALIEEFSRHAAASCVFQGLAQWRQVEDTRDWKLWRGLLAVPFSVAGSISKELVPGTSRHADVLQLGAITLNTTHIIDNNLKDADVPSPMSVLSFLQERQQNELYLRLSEIAQRVIG